MDKDEILAWVDSIDAALQQIRERLNAKADEPIERRGPETPEVIFRRMQIRAMEATKEHAEAMRRAFDEVHIRLGTPIYVGAKW